MDAKRTYRIREIKDSVQKAFYGSKSSDALLNHDIYYFTEVDVKTVVFGYFKMRFVPIHSTPLLCHILTAPPSGSTILDTVALDTPPFERTTLGTWVDVPKGLIHTMRSKGLNPAEGIHSAAHAVMKRFSLAVDLATECKVGKKEYMGRETKRKRPGRLIWYDRGGRGTGVAARMFDSRECIKECIDV